MKLWKKRYCNKVFSSVMAVVVAFGAFPANDVHAEQSLAVESRTSFVNERTKEFNDDWQFCLEPKGSPEEINYDDSEWTDVTLPHISMSTAGLWAIIPMVIYHLVLILQIMWYATVRQKM